MKIKTKILLIIMILFINIGIGISQKPHVIINNTNITFIDTIVRIGLNELELKRTRVYIEYVDMDLVSRTQMKTGQRIKAYIVARGEVYTIYIGKYSKRSTIKYIAHELIHLKQYQDKKLHITEDGVLYDNHTYQHPQWMEYGDRPWERDAIKNSYYLRKSIKKQLDKVLKQ